MPTIDLSDEELQGLIHICATGSGPGVNWMLTNAILSKAQAAAQSRQTVIAPQAPQGQADGLDHDPIAQPPAFTGKGAGR